VLSSGSTTGLSLGQGSREGSWSCTAEQETGKWELWLQALVWRLGILNSIPGLTCKDKETTCLAATVLCLRARLLAGRLFFFAWGFIFR